MSEYVFNYPVHNAAVSWQAAFGKGFLLRTRLWVLSRFARHPYALWDIYLADTKGHFTPFVQFTNVTNTHYEEIEGVAMPGRAAVIGAEWRYGRVK
jgi:iron complex outermembrane receptor protein